jgi:cytochrome c peroxidase
MHNGGFKTLDEVIEFYNRGGGAGMGLSVPNQTLPATKLNLSKQDKKDIISFIKALTDTSGINKLIF